jgi:hypothetical protein
MICAVLHVAISGEPYISGEFCSKALYRSNHTAEELEGKFIYFERQMSTWECKLFMKGSEMCAEDGVQCQHTL